MKKNKYIAFTMVELMVVMAILWVLATLGFISYQWYSADARDTKRKSDVWNITKQLELNKINWEDIFSFALNTDSTINSDINISWYQSGLELGLNYKAWDADYVYLDLVWESFTDPKTGDIYKVWITSHQNRYEVAWSLENNWDYKSYVDGTWLPRLSSETVSEIDKIIWNEVYLSGTTKSDLLLYSNDVVTIWWLQTEKYIIDKVFYSKLQLDRPVVVTWSTIELFSDESEHIIKSWSWDYPISTKSWTLYTPYNLEP